MAKSKFLKIFSNIVKSSSLNFSLNKPLLSKIRRKHIEGFNDQENIEEDSESFFEFEFQISGSSQHSSLADQVTPANLVTPVSENKQGE